MAGQIVSEAEFVRALDNLEKQADRLDSAHFRYLLGAVLPQSKVGRAEHMRDYYHLLKHSEHCSTALSLTVYVLRVVGLQGPGYERLLEYEKAETRYESDVSLPRFILRELLANIAKELSDKQASELVDYFAKLELNMHPDRLNVANFEFAKLLQVFTLAEEEELLKPEVKELPKLCEWLEHLGRRDLITESLDKYHPTRRIVLNVQDVQGLIAWQLISETFRLLSKY